MMNNLSSNPARNPPSTKDRIMAMRSHDKLFEMIANVPRAAVHERFSKEFQTTIAYMESKVHRCARAYQLFLEENSKAGMSPQEHDYASVMEPLVDALLRFDDVAKAAKRMSSVHPPSKLYMEWYRTYSRVDELNMRAANGEMASMYGQEGKPIPSHLAALHDDGLDPTTRFVLNFVINPLNNHIGWPSKTVLRWIPAYLRGNWIGKNDEEAANSNDDTGNTKAEYSYDFVSVETLRGISRAFVYVLAILLLIAPIAIFNSIENQTQRIVIMPFFCLLIVASAGGMGSETMPVFMMVIA
ncbi:hypothetical protein PtrSN002B_011410 [Pyrenophora tritici-repentis]|uniref:DUF6594 domain-containing protein n=1 Tax=Pyrenophora tritici-repentis TaxID=45151 RepID=A0A2W1CSW0_9PLEO|nr:hypothetical protein PtrV1_10501 [Pyrenophora tritici-repentis]KAF7446481.1 hypothetical protein A1F99_097720 [Pyrenophora tritici-repentis]KAF7567597.1 hypothetical protein PtrM4_141880 [Pyrenophora tritici-repentis]KAI0569931.1 hypothetical protein Alg215_11360 [Pyrenophora tritici-repentis]KAI0572928.1 hypothetical protein Alg130_10300 [Pyrenophora tritici-repentis]